MPILVRFTAPDGETTGYGYDGFNRRAFKNKGKNIIESYLYDGTDVLQEVSGPQSQKVTAYYRANGRIVSQQKYNISQGNPGEYSHRPEGRKLYYSYDALGSVASLSNHKGKQKTRYVYDVFGEVLAGDLDKNPYTFTGKRFDSESELYHFHFRQYDAIVGVWTTPDPIGIFGGVNLYSYVENDPVNRSDDFGLTPSAGELGVGNPGSYGGTNTQESMYGSNDLGAGNSFDSEGMISDLFSSLVEAFKHYWSYEGLRDRQNLNEPGLRRRVDEMGKVINNWQNVPGLPTLFQQKDFLNELMDVGEENCEDIRNRY